MATQRPISTISYNSEKFLVEKLETWRQAHIIQSYMYIFHKGEDGDKDHIHLRIEPNKRIDPMDLQADLREFELGNDKPLGCRPFRQSKEEDWIMYAVHDELYLKEHYSGGEKGEKIPYSWKDIRAPDDYDVEIAFVRARSKVRGSSTALAYRISHGEKPLDLLLEGNNVYYINAISRVLAVGDYQRLQDDFNRVSAEYNALFRAVLDYGLRVVVVDGKTILQKEE